MYECGVLSISSFTAGILDRGKFPDPEKCVLVTGSSWLTGKHPGAEAAYLLT